MMSDLVNTKWKVLCMTQRLIPASNNQIRKDSEKYGDMNITLQYMDWQAQRKTKSFRILLPLYDIR
jgi:hypothetical protein